VTKHIAKILPDLGTHVCSCYEAQNRAFGRINGLFLLNLIKSRRAKTIIDVGTGEGSFILELARQTRAVQYMAVEALSELIECAKNRQAKFPDSRVQFIRKPFDAKFPQKKVDMILARFSVEHMTDVRSFLHEARLRLEREGALAIIEYYVSTDGITDSVWSSFRKRELKLYQKIGSHAKIPLALPHLMNTTGFENISSRLEYVSPATIGPKLFFDLVEVYAQTYARIDQKSWPASFVKKVVGWCALQRKSPTSDPYLIISHTVGFKK
jgi:ubiquinone/menaquinone biosynthesis C-methylase UbiE